MSRRAIIIAHVLGNLTIVVAIGTGTGPPRAGMYCRMDGLMIETLVILGIVVAAIAWSRQVGVGNVLAQS
jgi:hypothetical protein